MTSKQRQWILQKSVDLIAKYNCIEKLTQNDIDELLFDVTNIIEKSKDNKRCKDLMLSIVACFDSKEQTR